MSACFRATTQREWVLTPWGGVHGMATHTYSGGGDVHLVVAGLRGGEKKGGHGGGRWGGGSGGTTSAVGSLCLRFNRQGRLKLS